MGILRKLTFPMIPAQLLLFAFAVQISSAVPLHPSQAPPYIKNVSKLLNVSAGRVIPGLGGIGGEQSCNRYFSPSCSAQPRQLVWAVDYAIDPSGRHLYVATRGITDIGQCIHSLKSQPLPACFSTGVHDNTSRLVYYDLQTQAEPVTMSYCGPWQKVEYDAKRNQVVALRNVNLATDEHGTHYGAEVVAFPAQAVPAKDLNVPASKCYNKAPLGEPKPATCACAMGFDPTGLNGKVIGRQGLKHDGIAPPSTMRVLGDNVLVGDQNQHCVVAYPLDGSAGSSRNGVSVAGTCGKSCNSQGCASIGSPSVPAGKRLGKGNNGLAYELYPTPDGRLYLHDMNTETIDYGKAPKAATQYMTVPVDPGASSVYHTGTFSSAGDFLVQEAFSLNGMLLKKTHAGKKGEPSYGKAMKLITKQQLTAKYQEARFPSGVDVVDAQGIPQQWKFTANDKKVLALVSYASATGGSYLDHAMVEFDVDV